MREITRVDPLDLEKDQGVGILIPFGQAPIFSTSFETREALKVNLVSFLLTQPGERYFRTSLGTPLRGLLFENVTESRLETVRAFLVDTIQENFPRVELADINLDLQENTLIIKLVYSISDTDIEDEIIVNIEN